MTKGRTDLERPSSFVSDPVCDDELEIALTFTQGTINDALHVGLCQLEAAVWPCRGVSAPIDAAANVCKAGPMVPQCDVDARLTSIL